MSIYDHGSNIAECPEPWDDGRCGSVAGFVDLRPGMAKRMFFVAWGFFAIAAVIGFLLRLQFVMPLAGFNYGNFLHTHSHVAFLGWIYNAFFALAMRYFVPAEKASGYWRIFLVTQVSVVGILISFPLQGYGWASISFSTMHMVCAAIFVGRLLRGNRAGRVARIYLWAAAVCMFASSLGPLAVGPLLAGGLRDTIWHGFSIGYYLHFQYNGWFMFFLMAVLSQSMHVRNVPVIEGLARRGFGWLVAGCIFTLALVILPVKPVPAIFVVAALGGVAQVIGFIFWIRAHRLAGAVFGSRNLRIARWLAAGALCLFLVKIGLQALAAWPGLVVLATNHFTIIAFMHLVFLGIVTLFLLAWSLESGWIRAGVRTTAGLGCFATGAFASQLALAYTPVAGVAGWPGWPWFHQTHVASALLILGGVALVSAGKMPLRRRWSAEGKPARAVAG